MLCKYRGCVNIIYKIPRLKPHTSAPLLDKSIAFDTQKQPDYYKRVEVKKYLKEKLKELDHILIDDCPEGGCLCGAPLDEWEKSILKEVE